MNGLDILIAFPITYYIYKGIINGVVKEVLSIVGILVAVILTFRYLDVFSFTIAPLFEKNPGQIPFVSGIIIFFGTLIAFAVLAALIKSTLTAIKLNWLNRSLGAVFGALKSIMIIGTALFLFSGVDFPSEETRENSYLYPYILYAAPLSYEAISYLVPGSEDFLTNLEQKISRYRQAEDLPFYKNKN